MSIKKIQPFHIDTTKDFVFGNTTSANYFIGNGSLLTGIAGGGGASISNGTSNITIVSNANVNISSGGNANIAIITGTGVNVAGYVNATGNITGANINGIFYGSGNNLSNIQASNITGTIANATYSVTSGTANSVAAANVSGTVANATYAVTSGTAYSVSAANITGTIYATEANTVAGANVTGQVSNSIVAGTVYTNAQPNITSVGTLTSLNTSGDITVGGNLTVNGTTTTINATTVDVADLNITLAKNATTAAAASGAGLTVAGANATILYTFGTDSWNFNKPIIGNIDNATYANTAGVANSVAAANVIGTVANATYAVTSGTAYSVDAANITGTIYATAANTVAGANVVGTVSTATTAGTVTTNAQPNITSVGNLTSLNVTGNLAVTNVSVAGDIIPSSNNVFSLGNATMYWKDAYIGPGSLYINGTKVLEETSNAIVFSGDLNQTVRIGTTGAGDIQLLTTDTGIVAIKGPLQIQAGKYITSSNGGPIGFTNAINVDGLSSLSANTNLTISANGLGIVQINDDVTITGNLNVNGVGGNLSVTTLSVEDNIIDISSETIGTPSNNAGLRVIRGDEAAVQMRWNESAKAWQISNDGSAYLNIVGANAVNGNVNLGNAAIANYFVGNGSLLTGISSGSSYTDSNVAAYLPTYTGNLTAGNANLGNIVTANYVTGVLTTSAQPNITSIGTQSNLTVTGTITAGNVKTDNLLYANGSPYALGGGGGATVYAAATPPLTASLGDLWLDSETGELNVYFGGGWAAVTASAGQLDIQVNNFTSDGIQSSYTLTVTPAGTNYTIVTIGGVVQPRNYYTITGTTLSFGTAPPANNPIEVSIFGSSASPIGLAGSVTNGAQPNITSVGTLVDLTATGNTSLTGNLTLNNTALATTGKAIAMAIVFGF